MAAGYREFLRQPGATPLVVAGVLARLPLSMTGPSAVLLLRAHTGSSAPGALLSAGAGLAAAGSGPIWGRVVDRRGAPLPLVVTGLIQAAALLGVVLSARTGAVVVPILLGLVGGGATPPVTPTLRRWLGALPSELHTTAMGIEAICIEAVFLLGPSLVGVTVALAGPGVALVCSAVAVTFGAVGVAVSAAAHLTPPEAGPRTPRRERTSLLRLPALRAVVSAEFLQVAAFAATEVGIVTAAARDGHAALGGVILAIWAASSGLGGLVTTSLWRGPSAGRRYVLASVTMGLGLFVLSISRNPYVLLVLAIPAGLSIAPTNAAASAIVAASVPPERQAEAVAWGAAMAAPAGAAIGYAAGGGLVEVAPLAVTTLMGAGLASLAALIAFAHRRAYP